MEHRTKMFDKVMVSDITYQENMMNCMHTVLNQKYFNIMFSTKFIYSLLLGDSYSS